MKIFKKKVIKDFVEPDKDLLVRYSIISTPWFGIKIHKLVKSDSPLRGLHDHPWWFASFNFKGRYYEAVEGTVGQKMDWRKKRFRFHKAEELHRIVLDDESKPAWTIVINGPKERIWGFVDFEKEWTPFYEK